jgi:hypothetical protein
MSEREYQRNIEEAERRGYERAQREDALNREKREFEEAVWREMRCITKDFQSRIERLEKEIGNEDAPTICVCGVRSEREENDG